MSEISPLLFLRDYLPLEKITTYHSLLWGFITLQKGLSPLTHYPRGLSPLERIITSHALPWGVIDPQRGLLPLSKYPGGYFTPRKSDLLSLVGVLHPFIPFFPQLFWLSCLLIWYSKGYGLGALRRNPIGNQFLVDKNLVPE